MKSIFVLVAIFLQGCAHEPKQLKESVVAPKEEIQDAARSQTRFDSIKLEVPVVVMQTRGFALGADGYLKFYLLQQKHEYSATLDVCAVPISVKLAGPPSLEKSPINPAGQTQFTIVANIIRSSGDQNASTFKTSLDELLTTYSKHAERATFMTSQHGLGFSMAVPAQTTRNVQRGAQLQIILRGQRDEILKDKNCKILMRNSFEVSGREFP